ncbi:MAG: hypothetical protein WC476_12065 [Phycisphaerae bacterium]|jgi:hypothetical protein
MLKLLQQTAIESFRAGYGKRLNKHQIRVIREFILLRQSNPKEKFKLGICPQRKELVTQLWHSGDNKWMCLH